MRTATEAAHSFRALREAKGLSRRAVETHAGLSSAYLAQLESGRLRNPTADARARLADALGVPVSVAFAGFPQPRSDGVAERRRRVLGLYRDGKSHPEIAALLEMPRATVALDLKSSASYVPRPTHTTFKIGPRRITATAAAKKHGFDHTTLTGAIDAGKVRGTRHEFGGRQHPIWTVDPDELEHDLANLPQCGKEGCDRPALSPFGGCSGGHSRAIQTKGKSWRTREAIEKSSAAKRGKPRPDVRERVAAMHADPEQRYRWGVALAEGRDLPANSQRRWKGRLEGLKAAREKGTGRPRTELQPEVVTEVRRLTEKGFGRASIAAKLGISEYQVRNARSL
jgi:transcriptional regulator with XRE-family HTH domain